MLQTEFEFTLPKGYVDEGGKMHTKGVMVLATAADEILPLKDPRVQQNPAYHTIILLSRVVTKLGEQYGEKGIGTSVIEKLFISDLAFLQELYRKINGDGTIQTDVQCPKCEHKFTMEINNQLGE